MRCGGRRRVLIRRSVAGGHGVGVSHTGSQTAVSVRATALPTAVIASRVATRLGEVVFHRCFVRGDRGGHGDRGFVNRNRCGLEGHGVRCRRGIVGLRVAVGEILGEQGIDTGLNASGGIHVIDFPVEGIWIRTGIGPGVWLPVVGRIILAGMLTFRPCSVDAGLPRIPSVAEGLEGRMIGRNNGAILNQTVMHLVGDLQIFGRKAVRQGNRIFGVDAPEMP